MLSLLAGEVSSRLTNLPLPAAMAVVGGVASADVAAGADVDGGPKAKSIASAEEIRGLRFQLFYIALQMLR